MKNIFLTISFLLFSLVVFCQPFKAEGNLYFETIAEMNNYTPIPPIGAEVVYCVEDSTIYTWNRTATSWNSTTSDQVNGTLTTNYIPYANGVNSLSDSPIYFDGANLGINKTTGIAGKLHIANSSGIGLYVSPTGTGQGLQVFSSGSSAAANIQQFSSSEALVLRAGTGRAMQIITNPTSINHSTIASISNSSLGTGLHLINDYSQRSNITVTDGFGMYNAYNLENNLGTYNTAYRRNVSWVDVSELETVLDFQVLGNTGYSNFKFYGTSALTGFAKFTMDGQAILPDYAGSTFTSGSYSYVLAPDGTTGTIGKFPLSALQNHTYDNSTDGGVDLTLTGSNLSAKINLDSLTADPSPNTTTTYLAIQTAPFSAKKILIDDFMIKAMDSYNDGLEVVESATATAANTAATSTNVGEEFFWRVTGGSGLIKMRKE